MIWESYRNELPSWNFEGVERTRTIDGARIFGQSWYNGNNQHNKGSDFWPGIYVDKRILEEVHEKLDQLGVPLQIIHFGIENPHHLNFFRSGYLYQGAVAIEDRIKPETKRNKDENPLADKTLPDYVLTIIAETRATILHSANSLSIELFKID